MAAEITIGMVRLAARAAFGTIWLPSATSNSTFERTRSAVSAKSRWLSWSVLTTSIVRFWPALKPDFPIDRGMLDSLVRRPGCRVSLSEPDTGGPAQEAAARALRAAMPLRRRTAMNSRLPMLNPRNLSSMWTCPLRYGQEFHDRRGRSATDFTVVLAAFSAQNVAHGPVGTNAAAPTLRQPYGALRTWLDLRLAPPSSR